MIRYVYCLTKDGVAIFGIIRLPKDTNLEKYLREKHPEALNIESFVDNGDFSWAIKT